MSFRRALLPVLSLAAGIGLTAAVASVADAILFRPLPVARPSEVVRIYTAAPDQPLGFVSYPDYRDLRDASRTMAGAVAQSQVLLAVGDPGVVRLGLAVTANYFDLLGVPPALGRNFRPGESREPVVLLAYRFWETHYGAAPLVVGRPVRIGGAAFLVIGVAAKDFGLDRFMHEDFYIPMEVYGTGLLPVTGRPLEDRSRRYLTVYGRIARGASLPQVQAELSTAARRLEEEHPETNRARRAVALTELASRMRAGPALPALAALLAAIASLLLAIACANAAGMLLLCGEARAHEIAIRLALGLSEGRLLAQLLMESLRLAAMGAALGMPLAREGTRALVKTLTLPTDLPLAIAPRIDWRAAALAAGVTLLAALVCGVAPWIAARRMETVAVLRTRGGGGSSGIARSVLVTAEIALAVALAATGGLLVRQSIAAGTMDLGYRLDHVLLAAFDPAQAGYTESQTRAFYRRLMEGVERLPGVRSVALAQAVPLGFTGAQRQIDIEGQDHLSVWMNTVSPGYFDLMRMRVVDGRGFDGRDTETSPPTVVINEALARFWRHGEAVGRRIRMNGRTLRVAGVVRTAKYFQLSEPATPFFYLPYSQNYASRMALHVETEGPPGSSAPAVLHEAREIDASQPASEVRTLEDYFSQGGLIWIRVGLRVVGAVGLCGLLLGLTGLYSVVASAAARRRREIGIRVAVGASRCVVVGLVLRHGAGLVALGAAGGLAMAIAMSRLLTSFGIGTGTGSTWLVLVLSTAAVAATAITACLVPAWRATGIDPAIALREE